MNRVVLDASAVLALMYQEPGGEAVTKYLPGSLLSVVNLAEVASKAADAGMSLEETNTALSGFSCEIIPFDAEQAYVSASLRPATRRYGLSLADRACLALGLKAGLPVVTADRGWESCDVGVEIIRIR